MHFPAEPNASPAEPRIFLQKNLLFSRGTLQETARILQEGFRAQEPGALAYFHKIDPRFFCSGEILEFLKSPVPWFEGWSPTCPVSTSMNMGVT